MKKQQIRLLVIALVGIAALVGAFVYKSGKANQMEADTRHEAEMLVRAMPSYHEHAQYLDGLVADAHPAAWNSNFSSMNVTGGTVNATAYVRQVITTVLERLRAEDKPKLAQELELAVTGLSPGLLGEEEPSETDDKNVVPAG